MLKAVFFDLDGTLLPMVEEEFKKLYMRLLSEKMKDYGYDPKDLINSLWLGVEKMYQNDGSRTNEEVFWQHFSAIYGKKAIEDKSIFDSFYVNEFARIRQICRPNPYALSAVRHSKEKGLLTILSTNPLFPISAILTRMEFVGLQKNDFDFITSYENFGLTKPNPEYFNKLLEIFDLKPDEAVVFGNNDVEDFLCARQAGMDCVLVGDLLILHEEMKINCPKMSMSKLEEEIDRRLKLSV